MQYILSIDQSTQGTKGLLFDENGALICRADLPHRQIVNDRGWVEHDPQEIYQNTILAARNVVLKAGVDKKDILAMGISNQRETSLVWDPDGTPVYNAIVWQDSRAEDICREIEENHPVASEEVMKRSGIRLSPYFPAAKLSWILKHAANPSEQRDGAMAGNPGSGLHMGTIDTWLVYKLTHGKEYRTDYSNASRTQLFNITTLKWDPVLCDYFDIPIDCLPEATDSDGFFGETDLEGFLDHPIPIHGVLGDSHGALFGQGCVRPGMIKSTYGTGSSIMMNVGEKPVFSSTGVVSSLAWKIGGKVNYVLEGNINYTGAVITWIQKDLGLVESAGETEELAREANPNDRSYLVPAFTGLGAPYWDSDARALLYSMSRTTGRKEIVKDALECIAYQITDIVKAMEEDMASSGSDNADDPADGGKVSLMEGGRNDSAGTGENEGIQTDVSVNHAGARAIRELRVDGGPTKNSYLMQFQSDIAGIPVKVSPVEELSGQGAAYAAGVGIGFYDAKHIFDGVRRKEYVPVMSRAEAALKYQGWKTAVGKALT